MFFRYELSEIWQLMIEHDIATEEELQLVTDLMGYTRETLELILENRTGKDTMVAYLGEQEIYHEVDMGDE